MLSVVNSGKFILTLQSTPPFVIESIFALALAVLLVVPLITHLQFYLEEPSKRKRNTTIPDVLSNESSTLNENHEERRKKNGSSAERIRRAVVMHYPAPISVDTSSSSDFDLQVGTPSRRTASTPNLCSNCAGDGWFKDESRDADHQRIDQQGVREIVKKIKPKRDVLVDRSSSFVATNSELPIIDISTFNYNSYRHKLIEASLKKKYRERQPPGDVIFNSIHLSTTDSTLGIRLNEEYEHSFFDFVEEYYDATAGMSIKEMEFLHPLDHFLVRGARERETSEKATDTVSCTTNQTTDQRENVIEKKPIDRRRALDKNGNISKAKGKNFAGVTNKQPGNESPRSMDSKKDTEKKGRALAAGPVDSNSIRTKVAATASNVDRARTRKSPGRRKSSAESVNSRKLGSSIVKADKESINVTSSSSSEVGSAYSETGKQPRNATSDHSRDSSVPPSRGRTATRKLLPWITGNTSASFNRKYGNKSPEAFDRSPKRKVRSSERPSTGFSSRTTSPRPRSANLSRSSRKANYQDSSELEETVKNIENYTTSKEEFMRSNAPELLSSPTFEPSLASTLPSRISSRPLSKLFVPFENDGSIRSMFENVSGRGSAKFKEKRDRAAETKSMRAASVEENREQTYPGINDRDRSKVALNFDRGNAISRSCKTMPSVRDDRPSSKSTAEVFENVINKAESWKESTVRRRDNEKPRSDIFSKKDPKRRQGGAGLSNLDKTRELSRGNKSDRCSRDKTNSSRSAIESRDTLTKDEKLRLPRGDSKVGLAMQTGLKNYIKMLKQVLKNGGNVDLVDLASLSLTDAISPELESILSSSELKELQDLLNIAEIKSNLAAKDVVVV
ncbi:hypothetical protein KPH14_004249 [Odynerus spinipes]|uniref:Uncharacterized protein n=1 Tax=Odynerus spinipes TaxID=1348599 RepID=A0AAD9VV72_9HYME|nr:hypothetical protein KPH14_004249 [Odynerus spinipes]